MTPKERMLAAYRGLMPDATPVAPEFWTYIPARLLELDMVEFERQVPLWEALHRTFRHYGTEGWGAVFASAPAPDTSEKRQWIDKGNGRFESRRELRTPHGTLSSSRHFDRNEPSWAGERPVKDFHRDWAAYRSATMEGIPEEADWTSVNDALHTVGDDYLLEVSVGTPFFDYIATPRDGGLQQGVFDLIEHESFFEQLHEEYLEWIRRMCRTAAKKSCADSFFIGCSWSCVSLIGPELWRRWDKPVIQAAADELHAAGKLLHVHFHGKCRAVLEDLAECGADCICPFERPPGGDVTDITEVRTALKGRAAFNGNVHTVETLLRGTPEDVELQVAEILRQWGPDRRRLVIGTGDQVCGETPDENIRAMIETGRKLGRNTP